jgi:predicted Zn-dependent protease
VKQFLFLLAILLLSTAAFSQEQLLNVAKQYLMAGDFIKAAATYKQLAEYNPDDDVIQSGYFKCLMGLKDYKSAEGLLKKLAKSNKQNTYDYDFAKLYVAIGEQKKANKYFDKVIEKTPKLEKEYRVQAEQFTKDGFYEQAIIMYEKGKKENGEDPYLFAEELAILYDKKGDTDKARESLIDIYISQPSKSEEVKSTFQRMYNKPEKLDAFGKIIKNRMDKDPMQMAYPELMSWLYIQQNDYVSAYKQIKWIDSQLNEQGGRVLGFARNALREKQYKASQIAYNDIIAKGKEQSFYQLARSEKLTCMKDQLQKNPLYTQEEVSALSKEYALLIDEFPMYKTRETYREYAELEARYAHHIDKAIDLLTEITKANNVDKQFRGRCKLEQGDYELIRDNQWESTLLYSQVDKEFKQDVLGEEARFRNAKLSYYAGDFTWAQGQLDVLKASTSELIANDALNLSVLITENNPIADSNTTPLLMFARADLLEFQNKDEACIAILDSITEQFPKHPLMDNILMERSRISIKKQDYNEAAMHLQKIVDKYGDDILADDAVYQLAVINETFFQNKDEAKRLFEQILIKYPGSTFVTEARKNFRRLRGDKADVEADTPLN